VNRTGTDGNGIAHVGFTMVVDAFGIPVAEAGEADEKILQVTLDRKGLDDYRARFPVACDWASQHLSNTP